MSDMPAALQLAALQEQSAMAWKEGTFPHQLRTDTAAELRRLHQVSLDLLERTRIDQAVMHELRGVISKMNRQSPEDA